MFFKQGVTKMHFLIRSIPTLRPTPLPTFRRQRLGENDLRRKRVEGHFEIGRGGNQKAYFYLHHLGCTNLLVKGNFVIS
jgi:hypothetical protein